MHLSNNIDFISGAIGGTVIAVSSTVFLALTGRLTGISGTVENSLVPSDTSKLWSITYLVGLVSAGVFYGDVSNTSATVETILAGVLVGFGTRMGTGCTSGHGICGLPRLSLRSFVAVSSFMFGGAVTAFLKRYLEVNHIFPILTKEISVPQFISNNNIHPIVNTLIPTVTSYIAFYSILKLKDIILNKNPSKPASHGTFYHTLMDHVGSFIAALTFGYGLVKSGMCDANKVIGFLDFTNPNGWDPSLIAVMGSGVILNFISFNILHIGDHQVVTCPHPNKHEKSTTMKKVLKMGNVPENNLITDKLVIGSLIFGLGWGLGGICPGPALVNLGSLSPAAAIFIPSILFGVTLHEFYKDFITSSNKKKSN